MKFDDLESALRTRPEGAPSDLELDRLVSGQLDEATAQDVETRAEGFPERQERLKRLRAREDAPSQEARDALLRRLEAQREPPRKGKLLTLHKLLPLMPLAAAAALLLTLLPRALRPHEGELASTETRDVVRSKGSLKLEVMRRRGDRAEPTVSGDVFHAGDTLRFVVTLPSAGRVEIVGIEADGKLYTAWPLPEHRAAAKRPAGDRQALPGAVTLDATPGREMLYLVLCPQDVAPACKSGGIEGPPACATGCRSTPFALNKE